MSEEAKEAQQIFEMILSVSLSLVLLLFFFGSDFLMKYLDKRYSWIHFHFFRKKITQHQHNLLTQHYTFYLNLKPKYRKSFDHRVKSFIKNYKFIGRQDFLITEDVKTLIAGNYVILTFGMNEYLANNFHTILIYPSYYFSNVSNQNHIGEFNPRFKVVVFSWEDFMEGISTENNNLNLGIHEFSHAILEQAIDSTSKMSRAENDNFSSFSRFGEEYENIKAYISSQHNQDLLKNSGYFRDYAFKNNYEFIAVILEYFYESPQEFKLRFPLLYEKVKKMVNYDETCFSAF